METFRQHITQIADLTEQEWRAFTRILNSQTIHKKQLFLQAGRVCYSSAFVVNGIFKLYTIDTQGNEKIIQFNFENTFLSDCESYINKKPSDYSIEALENSELIVYKNADLEKLCAQFPVFEKIGRQITHEIISDHKEHLKILMTMTPQERYEYLLANRPHLIQRVSVTHLSQFLGLTRETVSRLRSKIAG